MFDFSRLTAETDRYNFHSHTQFCDARDTMEAFARRASAEGFRHYGFSPHSPLPIPSPCNMRSEDVPAYLGEVKRLQQLFPQVHFYASMEIDYLGDAWGPAHPYFQELPLDYRIGSVHFIPTQRGNYVDIDGSPERFAVNVNKEFGGDLEYVVRTYYSQSLAMVQAGGFDLIGHLDKIGFNASHVSPGIEDEGWYRELVTELIMAISQAGITVEINTKAYQKHRRIFPRESWIPLLRQLHIPMVVNSDAHFPDLIDAGRAYACGVAAEASSASGFSVSSSRREGSPV